MDLNRRRFLEIAGASTAGLVLGGLAPAAGAASPEGAGATRAHPVPAEKNLDRSWLESLWRRGEPEVSRGDDLRFIGMPVGGICCGQLYLGGDGRLWHWDIFRSSCTIDCSGLSAGPHYARPMEPSSPIDQGFALAVALDGATRVRTLDARGFRDVSFRGQYPIGLVRYRDPDFPLAIDLEAFSPFVPLRPEDSALPVTVMAFTLTNTASRPVEVLIAGRLQNGACLDRTEPSVGLRRNTVLRRADRTTISMTAEAMPAATVPERRPDVVFAEFEEEDYAGWTAEGTSFGTGPFARADMAPYHDVSGHSGERLVNTHQTRGGEDVRAGDAHTGTLTSPPFVIGRRFVNFRIGGGRHPGRTCMDLLVGGRVVRTATGHNANRMRAEHFDVSELQGAEARLRIVDGVEGPWGHIGIDRIVFSDEPAMAAPLEKLPGFGSMALSLLSPGEGDLACAALPEGAGTAESIEALRACAPDAAAPGSETRPFGRTLVGALGRRVVLGPGGSATVTFLVSWWFPLHADPPGEWSSIRDIGLLRRHYAGWFPSASAAAAHVARRFEPLASTTRLWRDTWYGSTLPHWFLDRTFVTLDCLATQTCHWFDNGRFYAWEGVHCCPGTCQHVWQYAQGPARIFPQLERTTREMVDYGIAFRDDGRLDYRAEAHAGRWAADGQAGSILRVCREHQMSPDGSFLKRIWSKVRRSIEFMMAQDADGDGLLEGEQYNTLDASWYGPMAWISSLYLAAVAAGERMARDAGDEEFAARCAGALERGRANIVKLLYNGEYFVHRPDPAHPEATNTNEGCHIDQVMGQGWAWSLGLPRVVPRDETRSALRALWKYNFAPDVGPYREAVRKVIPAGRWYAMPGEGGLLMCTWPRGGAEKAPAGGPDWAVGYFNECMSGFEYQVAAHMIWEGLVQEGLAITRTVHDRYHPSKRNPFNEVECGDHYARAMAGYGVFLAACGYEHDGPRGHLGFAPRMGPDDFRAAFTAAEGWGTFGQTRDARSHRATIEIRHGRLALRSLSFELAEGRTARRVTVGGAAPAAVRQQGERVLIELAEPVTIEAGGALEVAIEL